MCDKSDLGKLICDEIFGVGYQRQGVYEDAKFNENNKDRRTNRLKKVHNECCCCEMTIVKALFQTRNFVELRRYLVRGFGKQSYFESHFLTKLNATPMVKKYVFHYIYIIMCRVFPNGNSYHNGLMNWSVAPMKKHRKQLLGVWCNEPKTFM